MSNQPVNNVLLTVMNVTRARFHVEAAETVFICLEMNV